MNCRNAIIAKTTGLFSASLFFILSTAQNVLAAEPFQGSINVLNKVNPSNTIVRSSVTQILGTWITRTIAVLSIVALLYIVYSGFIWMTSQNSEDVNKAKKTMIYLAIGIIILMSAMALTTFVFSKLFNS